MASPKVWLITGTSSGFGDRLVSIVRARGDRVIATARTLAKINHFLNDPAFERSTIHCAGLDISLGTEQVKKQIDTIIQESGWGTVDVLVNNAGLTTPAFIEEGGSELMRYQYQTNVFGTLDVTTAVLPYMRSQKSGTVVIMGSRSGWRPEVKGGAFYASSKAAIHAIAETMAIELKSFNIRVLIVEPGSFRTEGIFRGHFMKTTSITDYDEMRESAENTFKAPAGKQKGDPVKAMKALVEVVCGEGRAEGRPWPLYLVLGKDAEQDVRTKCTRMIGHLEGWSDVVRNVDLDDVD